MAGGIEGVRELGRKLDLLPAKAAGSILRKAVRDAAKPVIDAAKANIPEGIDAHKTYKGRLVAPGFAKRAIRAAVSLSKDKRAAFARIGVRREAFYAVNFVELGTAKQAKQPWLRPAMEDTQQEQVSRLADRLKKEIEKVARK